MKGHYKACQSCGKPLSVDGRNNGTEVNGCICDKYCLSCYQGGKFIHGNISLEEMKVLAMQAGRYPKLLKWYYLNKLPRLERWNHEKEPASIWNM